jgi:TonB-linked SusC/RagA family outer membrane protein
MKHVLLSILALTILTGSVRAFQQERSSLTGTVTAADGLSLPGALIYLAATEYRTISDEAGRFELSVPTGAYTLIVSYIGMESARLEVKVPQVEPLTILLKPSETELAAVEIVSTGYQSLPKERATGSFAFLDSQLVQRKVSATVLDRLEDVTPGLIFNRGINATNEPVTIRGRSTVYANTSPLIIVDNFPYDGPLENINPNDVASMTVLRDAAAASIWGARAGNGVIVITTVKGSQGQPLKVSLNSNVTVSEERDRFYVPQMSISDFIDIEQELFSRGFYRSNENSINKPKLSPAVETMIALRDGKISETHAEALLDTYRQSDIRKDIRDYYQQPGLSQQYSVSLSGGSANHAYQVSLGFDQNRTNIVGNDGSRWTLAVGDQWTTLNDKLEIGMGINLSNRNSSVRTETPTGFSYDRLADGAGNPLAIASMYSTRYIQSVENSGLLDWSYVPLNEIGKLDNRTQAHDFRISPSVEYSIIPGLKVGLFYQYWKNLNSTRSRSPLDLFYTRDMINKYTQQGPDGSLSFPVPKGEILDVSQTDTYSHTLRPQLTYIREWSGKHFLNSIAGMEIRDLQGLSESGRYYGYRDDMGISLPVDMLTRYPFYYNKGQLASVPSEISHGGNIDRFVSYYANAGYDYAHKYFLTLSARKDQANIFGVEANMKGVPLWSVGGAWIVSEEGFVERLGIPFLKLRATYGYSGNVDKSLSSEVTATYVTYLPWDILPQVRAAGIVNPPNSGLRWEKVKITNLALDLETRNGFLAASVEVYSKLSTDLLGQYSVAAATGRTEFTGNFAESQTRGVDISLSAHWFRKEFRWSSNLFYSGLREEITDFEVLPTVANLLSSTGIPTPYPMIGRPLYGIYAYEWAGLSPDTGNPRGLVDGEPSEDYLKIVSQATVENLQYHGSARPTSFGAFRNDFSYRGFSLSVNVSYRMGYYYRRRSIDYYTLLRGSIGHGDFERRWQKPGDEQGTQVPSMPATADTRRNNFYTNSGALIERGDHIRLNDIRVSYTFNQARFPGLPVKGAEIYAYASNLGIIWKASDDVLDPDYPTSRPLKSLALGLRIDF